MSGYKTCFAIFSFAVILNGFVNAAVLADEADDIIKYRQNIMRSLAADSRMIKAIVTGKISSQADLIPLASSFVAMSKMLITNFPEGSDFGETDAKEDIWENMDDFTKKQQALEISGQEFLQALKNKKSIDVLREKYTAIGKSCKSCHKKYREK